MNEALDLMLFPSWVIPCPSLMIQLNLRSLGLLLKASQSGAMRNLLDPLHFRSFASGQRPENVYEVMEFKKHASR